MQRIAFQLSIRPDKIAEYEQAHRQVWPELLAEMESFGISEYSIFRRGQQLFLYMQIPDSASIWEDLNASEINLLWQKKMAPLFEPIPDLQPGEIALMKEVFYMQGRSSKNEG